MIGRLRLAALVLAAAMLSACSSAEPTLYTIASVPGAVQTRGPKVIMLRQIGLAHYLERPEIVRSAANYQLNVRTNEWWGEPLGAMLSRVLIDELGQRLPQSTVLGETGAVSTAPDATVELNVQRLDEDGAGALLLQGQASVSFKGHATPILRNFRLTAPLATPGARDEVAAISAATGQLADGLAAMLLAAPAAGPR